jgi:hypothetical protein
MARGHGLHGGAIQEIECLFMEWYRAHYGPSMAERHAGLEVKPAFDSEEELLLFTLFSLKCGLSYDPLRS